MGWEEDLFALFDDLEQQAAALYDADRDAELADRSRAEYQQVTLASRLMASVDRDVTLDVTGVGAVAGRLERVAAGWCVVRGPAQDWVISLAAVATVHGASDRSVPEVAWAAVTRLGLGSALRRLADAEERCVLHLLDGGRNEGVPTRVGADFVEVLVATDRQLLVPFGAIAAVQSHD
ncbi:hypothetical protein [Nocardioides sp.]|uniref:hypothetical protein n=1 Tax=Nocardioides sp. TaxID=35761 RepID=UPI0031FF3ED8|nr:hypothetical protein [Nocardioides sp.]